MLVAECAPLAPATAEQSLAEVATARQVDEEVDGVREECEVREEVKYEEREADRVAAVHRVAQRLVARVVPDGEAGERRVDGAVNERDRDENERIGDLLRGELVDADRHAPAGQFGHVQLEEQDDGDDEREHCVARRHAALDPHEQLRQLRAHLLAAVRADLRLEELEFGEAVVECRY